MIDRRDRTGFEKDIERQDRGDGRKCTVTASGCPRQSNDGQFQEESRCDWKKNEQNASILEY